MKDIKFKIGELVFLVTDPEKRKRIVTEIKISPDDVTYYLSCGSDGTWHYGIEMAAIR